MFFIFQSSKFLINYCYYSNLLVKKHQFSLQCTIYYINKSDFRENYTPMWVHEKKCDIWLKTRQFSLTELAEQERNQFYPRKLCKVATPTIVWSFVYNILTCTSWLSVIDRLTNEAGKCLAILLGEYQFADSI